MPVEQELIEKAVTGNTSAFEELITPPSYTASKVAELHT